MALTKKKKIITKKPIRKRTSLQKTKVKKTPGAQKPIGVVTHYYRKIGVGIIKCKIPLKVGITIRLQGATTNFSQIISGMQYNHKDVKSAKKNKLVGIKMKKRVREGDVIYRVV